VNEESDEEIRQMRMQLQLERFRPILNIKHFGKQKCNVIHNSLKLTIFIFSGQNITTEDSSVSPTSSVSTITPPLSPSCSLASTHAIILCVDAIQKVLYIKNKTKMFCHMD
jgi:hypothetical protein